MTFAFDTIIYMGGQENEFEYSCDIEDGNISNENVRPLGELLEISEAEEIEIIKIGRQKLKENPADWRPYNECGLTI